MKKHNESCKQGRKKAGPISLNAAAAGGIERVVALGGALAVASLIAAFSIKKGGKKDSNKDKVKEKDTTNVAAPALELELAPAPANESCVEKDHTGEQLSYIQNESPSAMLQKSCFTNIATSDAGLAKIETSELVSTESLMITLVKEENTIESECKEDSVVVQPETPVHDAEHESDAMAGDHGDVQEHQEPVDEDDNSPTNVVRDERLASLGMEFIEITIVDESVNVDAEQPALQPSSPSKEEENSSISTGEQQEDDSLMQSSFPPPPLPEEEEQQGSLMQSSFPPPPLPEEEEQQGSLMQSSPPPLPEEEEEEEGSLMQSSPPPPPEEEQEQGSLTQSAFSPPPPPPPEEEEEDDSLRESSVSTEEEEEEEDSALQSSFSTEVEEDANGENAAELDEESSEGTWSSSQEPNMEVIWPAEIMAFISSAPKEVNLSHLESEMKVLEDKKPPMGEPNHYPDRNRFGGRNNKETGEPALMDVRKQHATKRQAWFWLGFAVLVLALLANCLLQSNYISNNFSFAFLMK